MDAHYRQVTKDSEIAERVRSELAEKDLRGSNVQTQRDFEVAHRKAVGLSHRLQKKYNHSITCPVCENETRFWREEPFPAEDPTSALSIRQMLKDMNL